MVEMHYLKIIFLTSTLNLFVIHCNARPQISLEYKPMKPFYQPRPDGYLNVQIIPSGKPWPASAEGYTNFSQITSVPQNLENMFKETTTTIGPPPQTPIINFADRIKEPSKISERPPLHSNSGDAVGQIIPPGQPWPSKPENYGNFSQIPVTPQLENRFKETTTVAISGRPPFHPNPGNNIGQIIPPGKPWPSKPEDYINFSQTSKPPTLEDRNQQTTISSNPPLQSHFEDNFSLTKNSSHILGQPPFYPNSGDSAGKIVFSEQLRPSNVEDSKNVSQATVENLEDKINETSSISERPLLLPLDPGNSFSQIILPLKPLSSEVQTYENVSQVSPTVLSVENKIKKINGSREFSFSLNYSGQLKPNYQSTKTPIKVEDSVVNETIDVLLSDNSNSTSVINANAMESVAKGATEASDTLVTTSQVPVVFSTDGPLFTSIIQETTNKNDKRLVEKSIEEATTQITKLVKVETVSTVPDRIIDQETPIIYKGEGQVVDTKQILATTSSNLLREDNPGISTVLEIKYSSLPAILKENDGYKLVPMTETPIVFHILPIGGYESPYQQPRFPVNSNNHFQAASVPYPAFNMFKKLPLRYFTHSQHFW